MKIYCYKFRNTSGFIFHLKVARPKKKKFHFCTRKNFHFCTRKNFHFCTRKIFTSAKKISQDKTSVSMPDTSTPHVVIKCHGKHIIQLVTLRIPRQSVINPSPL